MSDRPMTPDWFERANRLATVAALLSTTVHEVNNALQVISGSAEMLGAATSPDLVARRSNAIGSQARRASALLAELSAFARDEPREADVPKGVDLAQIGQRSLALRQYTLARLNIQSGFEGETRPVETVARVRPIMQIVLNLLFNSEHVLTGRPGARILVKAAQHDGRVHLTVDDNGPGIPIAELPRLFEPKMTKDSGALGIGLPVSRWLAEKEGGALAVTTSALGGCALTLSLPRR
jgi:two-component system NtrC family sensor kinase